MNNCEHHFMVFREGEGGDWALQCEHCKQYVAQPPDEKCFFCGGDAYAPGHAYTLRHRIWLWIDQKFRMA